MVEKKKISIQARFLDRLMSSLWKLRIKLIEKAAGDVLEIGVGTGLNFELYSAEVVSVVGIEPDKKLLALARERAAGLAFAVDLREGVAESLPFEEDSFDTVVLTWVMCSLQEPGHALSEIVRVLRPGGQLLWIEHTRSRYRVMRWIQNFLNPGWRRVAGNCHLNREPLEWIERAGFVVEESRSRNRENWNLFPIYHGVARKSCSGV